MACRLFGTKPSPKPMLPYFKLHTWEQIFKRNANVFMYLKMPSAKWWSFCLGLNVSIQSLHTPPQPPPPTPLTAPPPQPPSSLHPPPPPPNKVSRNSFILITCWCLALRGCRRNDDVSSRICLSDLRYSFLPNDVLGWMPSRDHVWIGLPQKPEWDLYTTKCSLAHISRRNVL